MNQIQANRLAKLISFLEELEPEKFEFAKIRTEDSRCGTTACAIGWTPEIFPNLVRIRTRRKYKRILSKQGFLIEPVMRDNPKHLFSKIPERLFGLHSDVFCPNSQNWLEMPDGSTLPNVRRSASPKTVANMLIKALNAHGYDYVDAN